MNDKAKSKVSKTSFPSSTHESTKPLTTDISNIRPIRQVSVVSSTDEFMTEDDFRLTTYEMFRADSQMNKPSTRNVTSKDSGSLSPELRRIIRDSNGGYKHISKDEMQKLFSAIKKCIQLQSSDAVTRAFNIIFSKIEGLETECADLKEINNNLKEKHQSNEARSRKERVHLSDKLFNLESKFGNLKEKHEELITLNRQNEEKLSEARIVSKEKDVKLKEVEEEMINVIEKSNSDIEKLEAFIAQLRKENEQLQDEVKYLKNIIKNDRAQADNEREEALRNQRERETRLKSIINELEIKLLKLEMNQITFQDPKDTTGKIDIVGVGSPYATEKHLIKNRVSNPTNFLNTDIKTEKDSVNTRQRIKKASPSPPREKVNKRSDQKIFQTEDANDEVHFKTEIFASPVKSPIHQNNDKEVLKHKEREKLNKPQPHKTDYENIQTKTTMKQYFETASSTANTKPNITSPKSHSRPKINNKEQPEGEIEKKKSNNTLASVFKTISSLNMNLDELSNDIIKVESNFPTNARLLSRETKEVKERESSSKK